MAGYFQLKTAASGQWMFNLKAGNHETVLTSQNYSSKQAAERAMIPAALSMAMALSAESQEVLLLAF